MPRPPRIHVPGGLYHVIARGNHGQTIFTDDQDYRAYLRRLQDTWRASPFRLYAFALMSNHVHLLVEVGEDPLSTIIKHAHQRYSQYFNKKQKKMGHVFQDRFKAILCQKDAYLLELVRYIHLNPVRAKIVADPEEYPWSSHKLYLAQHETEWLDRTAILMQFGEREREARQRYCEFVAAGLEEGYRGDLYATRDGNVLGDDRFLMALPLGALGDELSPRVPLDDIITCTCQRLNLDERLLAHSKNRTSTRARLIISAIALENGYRQKEVASAMDLNPSLLSRYAKKIKLLLKDDRDYAHLKSEILKIATFSA